ncbi:hypothetical protein [Altericista sp. CCNU0014]|uniref:hypothetical protein n=1 Tax=Altericista sp. CCNU0014 TaxID=3082949 RepID=UPI0038503DD1
MQPITLHSRVQSDGRLILQLPDDFKGYDVTVQVQAQSTDWLSILEQTAGSIPDLERPPQGDYEVRDLP